MERGEESFGRGESVPFWGLVTDCISYGKQRNVGGWEVLGRGERKSERAHEK